jgi:hypothetical protein
MEPLKKVSSRRPTVEYKRPNRTERSSEQDRGELRTGQNRAETRTEQSWEQKKPAESRTKSKDTSPIIAMEERRAVEDKTGETRD